MVEGDNIILLLSYTCFYYYALKIIIYLITFLFIYIQENEFFSQQSGFPNKPNEWKGKDGLYAAGFSRRGLLGVSMDATKIAEDIEQSYNNIYKLQRS